MDLHQRVAAVIFLLLNVFLQVNFLIQLIKCIFYIINSFSLKATRCDMIFELKLIEYNNPLGRTYLNEDCGRSKTASSSCNTGFLFCLVDLPFRNPQNCSLGDFSTPVLGNTSFIDFNTLTDQFTYKFLIKSLPLVNKTSTRS